MKSLAIIGFPDYSVTEDGQVYSHIRNKFLKPCLNTTGYHAVSLISYITGERVKARKSVHRLILVGYLYREDYENFYVNHKNGIKTDNRLENLEWCTAKENTHHAFQTGLSKPRKRFEVRSITLDQAHEVCKLLSNSYRNNEIEEITGVPASLVAKIRFGTHYEDVSKLYDLKNIKSSRRKMKDETVAEICKLLLAGKTIDYIAKTLRVGTATISNIKLKRDYLHVSDLYF